ncbi:MAG: 50S ribosomal protein L24 [Flavobacteriaceae bacterium]|jgi:large subunit ribosomal protein L24|nr:50S ribosomal protein L24 [Flavobacteriaceae bacterium]OUW38054.1 MAG: 50S ribosomal protein L24 [Flavobacteriaceae bacterium TMED184]|tara:strand:- start:496 stop:807 length:312 start_codon:yes stop_codon:yes gene_type:complete
MRKIKIKKDDKVRIITGENKGSEGKVLKVLKNKKKVLVEGVNIVKKHSKPNSKNPQGGIIEKESPVDISNLSLISSDGQNTRLGYRFEDGKKVRYAKKNNEII